MNWVFWFWLETWGTFTETFTIPLSPNANGYLGQAYLTLNDGGDYAHVYVSEVCTQSGDQQLCGINDEPSARADGIFAPNTVSVTYALHSTGGHHVAEGFLFSL